MDLVPAYTKALKLNNMGVELAKKNQILEAKHKFSEALMLFGGEARIYYNLACCEYAYTMWVLIKLVYYKNVFILNFRKNLASYSFFFWRFTCAEESCTECLKFDPVFPKAYLLRYKIKKEQEEEEENDANNDLLMYKELQERKNKNK